MRTGHQALALAVDSYRAGYKPEERRQLEHRLARGETRALTCTSALEMGLDVGALDATVHVGVPETAAAMWQQAGRAGRRLGASVAIVVTCERPLDAHYLRRPEEAFERRPEAALVDPANVAVLERHLPCAAFEWSIDPTEDAGVFDDQSAARRARKARQEGEKNPPRTPFALALGRAMRAEKHIPEAQAQAEAERRATNAPNALTRKPPQPPQPSQPPHIDRWCDGTPLLTLNPATRRLECRVGFRPHHHVSLRGSPSGEAPWTLLDVTRGNSLATGAKELELVDGHRALTRVYPRCVHQTRDGQFLVTGVCEPDRVAFCVAHDKPHFTSCRVRCAVDPLGGPPAHPPVLRARTESGAWAHAGRVRVRERVVGYVTKDSHTQATVDEASYPGDGFSAADFVTDAVWWAFPAAALRRVAPERERLQSAAQGVVNLCVALVPSIAMCDARDIAGGVTWHDGSDGGGPGGPGGPGGANANATAAESSSSFGSFGADQSFGATFFLYDACPDGVGLASKAFENIERVWERALATVAECACEDGCPSCVQAGAAWWTRERGGKRDARVILEALARTRGRGRGRSTCWARRRSPTARARPAAASAARRRRPSTRGRSSPCTARA